MNTLENDVDSLKKSLFSLNNIDQINNALAEFKLQYSIIEESKAIFYSDIFIQNLYAFIEEYGNKSNEFLEFQAKLIDKAEIFTMIVRNVLYNDAFEIISKFENTNVNDSQLMYEIFKKFYHMTKIMGLYSSIFNLTPVDLWKYEYDGEAFFNWEIYRTTLNTSVNEHETKQDNSIQKAGIMVLEWIKEHELESSLFESHDNSRSNKLNDEVFYQVTSGDIWGELAGTSASDFGTIDCIDEMFINHIYLILENNKVKEKVINLLIEIDISTQRYCDHEYITNGSETLLVEAQVVKNISFDQIEVLETRLIGIV